MTNHTRHRNVQGGASRAAVLGAGDGLITNVSLILGVAGASTAASPCAWLVWPASSPALSPWLRGSSSRFVPKMSWFNENCRSSAKNWPSTQMPNVGNWPGCTEPKG